MKIVQISTKSVYGSDMYYPANELAKSLLRLTGKKTFSFNDLRIMSKELGYQIEFPATVLAGLR